MTDYNHDPIVPRTGAAADLTATVVKASVQNELYIRLMIIDYMSQVFLVVLKN